VHFQDAPWYHPGLNIGQDHVCKVYQEWSNLCYVINRRSAQKLLDLVKEGITLPLDWFWSKQTHKINTYTLKPNIYSGIELQYFPSTFQATTRRLNFLEELAKDEN
jgi:GR25 family glycosyltransferase involved in LPS biosynthesis